MYFKFSLLFMYFKLFVDLSSAYSKSEPSWKECQTDTDKKLIDCSNVGFTKIPLDIYDSSWPYIRLSKNPFNCDCSMKTFLHGDRFQEYLQRTTDLMEAVCAQPTTYEGVKILKLADDPTFCKDDADEERAIDFMSFFKVNARFIASLVLVFLLLVLGLATCLRRCKKEEYSYDNELLPSYSRKRNPFFLSKLFDRTPKRDIIALNESTELTEWCEENDDILYENIR